MGVGVEFGSLVIYLMVCCPAYAGKSIKGIKGILDNWNFYFQNKIQCKVIYFKYFVIFAQPD